MAENNDFPEVSSGDPTTEADATTDQASAGAPDTSTFPVAGEPAPASGPVLVPRIRDRVWSFRAMLAVAVAALLIGGAGGAAVVAATDHGNDRPRIGRFGGPDGQRGPGHGFDGNGPGAQQAPPAPPTGSTS
ncbi:MAG: hypothetical protein JWQ74_2118 [Marmoricola sp.]|nr:hypothetical protein [Marmoricola sp.]